MSIRVVGYTPEGHRITEDEGPRPAVVHPTSVAEQIAHRPMVIARGTGDRLGLPRERRVKLTPLKNEA